MGRITREVSKNICATRYEDLPGPTCERAKLALLDNIGNMIGAYGTEIGQAYLRACRTYADGTATICGSGGKSSVMEAGFANGTLCQLLDYDDTYEIGSFAIHHPGPALVPSAVTMAELTGADGRQIVRALVLGYDVGIRTALAIEPRNIEFFGFSSYMMIGAVVSAIALQDLDVSRTVHALGLATASSPSPTTYGMWSFAERPLAWSKDSNGFVVASGLQCALLAEAGILGPVGGLDEECAFYKLAGGTRYDGDALLRDWGDRWYLDETSFKPFPGCRHTHAAVESLSSLIAEHQLDDKDIRSIQVDVPPFVKKGFEVYEPNHMTDAQFSLPHLMAMAVLGVTPGPDWYTRTQLDSPEVLATRRKVSLVENAEVERLRVEQQIMGPIVRITTADGRVLERQETVAKGHPEKPFSREDFVGKFLNQTTPLLGDRKARAVVDWVDQLEMQPSIDPLLALLTRYDAWERKL